MAKVGVLAVSVVAATSQFDKGLKKSGKEAQTFSGKVGKFLTSPLGLATAGIAAAVLAMKGFNAVMRVAGELDPIAKMSRSLGIAAEELQKLQFAAEQSGAGDVGAAMTKMTNVISEANQGLPTTVKLFTDLGLSFEALRELQPDQQFLKIADAIKALPNKTDQIGAMLDIFGRSGGGFINLMEEGSAGIIDFGNQLERAGGVIDTQLLNKMEQLNDAQNLFRKQWRATKAELAEAFAPAILNFLKELVETLKGLRDVRNDLFKGGESNFTGQRQTAQAKEFRARQQAAFENRQAQEQFALEAAAKLSMEAAADFRDAQKVELDQKKQEQKRDSGRITFNERGDTGLSASMRRGSQEELRARFEPQQKRTMEKNIAATKEEAIKQTRLLEEILAKGEGVPDPAAAVFIGPGSGFQGGGF